MHDNKPAWWLTSARRRPLASALASVGAVVLAAAAVGAGASDDKNRDRDAEVLGSAITAGTRPPTPEGVPPGGAGEGAQSDFALLAPDNASREERATVDESPAEAKAAPPTVQKPSSAAPRNSTSQYGSNIAGGQSFPVTVLKSTTSPRAAAVVPPPTEPPTTQPEANVTRRIVRTYTYTYSVPAPAPETPPATQPPGAGPSGTKPRATIESRVTPPAANSAEGNGQVKTR